MKALLPLAPLAAAIATLTLVACTEPSEPQGALLFAENCAACHGADARGDGPLTKEYEVNAPDLTLIAYRNSGTFPKAEVMSTIDGFTRVQHGNIVMPEFGAVLSEGPVVMYDSGDGIATPTPAALVALAEYLESLQRTPS